MKHRPSLAAGGVLPDGFELLRGPVAVQVTFHFARPQNHFGTGRKAGVVKRAAPHWHTACPDLDKLCRSLADALPMAIRARIDGLLVRLESWPDVRQETICRLESAKHSPVVRTVEKIDRALKRYAAQAEKKRGGKAKTKGG